MPLPDLVLTSRRTSRSIKDGGSRRILAAALQGGTEPDLLDEVASWQTDDFWQYALFAAVAYIRAAASRAGVPVRQTCQDPAQRPGRPAP